MRRARAPVISLQFPAPPEEYDQEYFRLIVRTLETTLLDLGFQAVIQGGELYLNNLPSRGSGLRIGEVFQDAGVLKIVRENDVFAGTHVGTMGLGTVTVVTT